MTTLLLLLVLTAPPGQATFNYTIEVDTLLVFEDSALVERSLCWWSVDPVDGDIIRSWMTERHTLDTVIVARAIKPLDDWLRRNRPDWNIKQKKK